MGKQHIEKTSFFPFRMVLPLVAQAATLERHPLGILAERLGRNLVRLRTLRGISRYRLSKDSGISNSHLIDLERGEAKRFAEETLVALGTALGVDPAILLANEIPEKAEVVIDLDTAQELFHRLGLQLPKLTKKKSPNKD